MIKREKNGKYSLDFSIGYVDGKKKRKRKKGFNTKKEAKKYETDFTMKYDSGASGLCDITFLCAFDDYKNYLKNNTKDSTYYSKLHRFEKHILPYFDNKPLREVPLTDYKYFREELSKKELSNNYKRDLMSNLSSFLNYFIR